MPAFLRHCLWKRTHFQTLFLTASQKNLEIPKLHNHPQTGEKTHHLTSLNTSLGEVCCLLEEFIRQTTATIKYESVPRLAAAYHALFFINTAIPNVTYHDTNISAASPCPPVPPLRCQLQKNRYFLRHLSFAHRLRYLIPLLPLHIYSSL